MDDLPEPPPEAQLQAATELLRALANPHRLAVVTILGGGPRCVHEIVDALDIPQPLASQHLKVLREVALVTTERRGREVVYALADHHVTHIVADALDHVAETRVRA